MRSWVNITAVTIINLLLATKFCFQRDVRRWQVKYALLEVKVLCEGNKLNELMYILFKTLPWLKLLEVKAFSKLSSASIDRKTGSGIIVGWIAAFICAYLIRGKLAVSSIACSVIELLSELSKR